MCAAIPTKSNENAYLSAMCAAFVKRMACKSSPEGRPSNCVDDCWQSKIASESKCTDRIQLKVERASKVHQPEHWRSWASTMVQWKVRFDACVSSWKTHLSVEMTPAMDVWAWLVRHAGWLLERYHVKANKKTVFEDCFGKPYQGEVMKFAEAAPFRVAVSPSGRES